MGELSINCPLGYEAAFVDQDTKFLDTDLQAALMGDGDMDEAAFEVCQR